jgi:UDP-N-acetylmuramoyl-L-alanyl-D-glutamate--2,6-diaminopimelate ligase
MTIPLATARDAAAWLAARLGAGATLRCDSRRLQPGDGFIAWPGAATDGRRFVTAALQAGAAACLVDAEGADGFGWAADDQRIATLHGLKALSGEVAAAFFGQPAQALQVIAVTGTNGKSSTAWWTAQALSALGRRCGVVGTLGIGEPPRAASGGEPPRAASAGEPPSAASGGEPPRAPSAGEPPSAGHPGAIDYTGFTTPDPVTLQAALRRMAGEGYAAVAIEASSIGIAEHRLAGTPITVAQFTNLTRDHLDYHGDMAAYWAVKRALFDWPGLQAAVINLDDAQGAALAGELAGGALDLWTTSVAGRARLAARDLRYVDGGLGFTLVEGDAQAPVRSTLIGDYNAANLLAVLGALRALGLPLVEAAAVVPLLTPVPGRMQRVPAAAGQPEVVVDFAHTPDALDKALGALRPLAAARGGLLWCVFGCGGNRDASKRPMMGAIAHRLADRVVLTSDNPRDESPALILAQILAGTSGDDRVDVIEDRHEAIAHAVLGAAPQDVVLVAGKGHEDTQEVAGLKRPFLDAAVAADLLAGRDAA